MDRRGKKSVPSKADDSSDNQREDLVIFFLLPVGKRVEGCMSLSKCEVISHYI